MPVETERWRNTPFAKHMAQAVPLQSSDADNRRYLPDEVFETEEAATAAVRHSAACPARAKARRLGAVPRKDGACIGQVQTVPAAGNAYEIDFSIDDGLVKQGYASEAVRLCVSKPAGRRCDKSQSRAGSKTKAGPGNP